MLGPLVCDIPPGYDHIVSSIGISGSISKAGSDSYTVNGINHKTKTESKNGRKEMGVQEWKDLLNGMEWNGR